MRARTVTPVPAAQTSQQQFVQYYRRLPNLILREALNRASALSKYDLVFTDPLAGEVASEILFADYVPSGS